jgi:hypothetical protein
MKLSERFILIELQSYRTGYVPAKHTTTEKVLKRMLKNGLVSIDSQGRYFPKGTLSEPSRVK